MRNNITGLVILVGLAGATLTACGSDNAQPKATPDSSVVSATPVVRMINSDFGSIVADPAGNALYAFTKDVNGVSACYDACATTWPPALSNNTQLTSSGITAGLLGVTDRKDGTKQLTLNGMPLYRFAADGEATGQVKGQANKGVWFVLNSDGSLNKSAAKPVAAATPTTAAPKTTSPPSTTAAPTSTTAKKRASSNYSYDY